jgi:Glyoxalase/Bleomycin resistance protein/Dioxygenase superfamily
VAPIADRLIHADRGMSRHRLPCLAMAEICTCCSKSVDWWVRLRSHPDLAICHDCLSGLNGQRDGQLQLMTGKWIATGFEPIFKVADVARSVAWFERAGFETSFHDDTYAFAHRDRDLTIHLAQAEEGELPGHGVLYIHCQDAGRAAEEWKEAGILVDGPRDEDYGKREGSLTDPDGNVIRFGSPIR